MSKNKREDDATKRVREETEPIKRQRCAGAETGEAGESRGIQGPVRGYVEGPGGPQDSKKDRAGSFDLGYRATRSVLSSRRP